jgi:hypothetical protein
MRSQCLTALTVFICHLFNYVVCKPDCVVLNALMIVNIELAGIWKEAAMYAEGSSTL